VTNPIFAAAFKPGEQITDLDLGRFHRFLKPIDLETPMSYAGRLAANGLALTMTSEEVRDIPQYKVMLHAAREQKVPLVVLTGVISAPSGDAPNSNDQAKADALAQARAAAR
jgi:hypothetical protein